MPRQKSKRKAGKRTARKSFSRPGVLDSLEIQNEMQNDKARFEPIIPQIGGRLSPEQSKLDQFERFAKAIKQVEQIQRYKLKQNKKFSVLEKTITIIAVILAINLVWLLIGLV